MLIQMRKRLSVIIPCFNHGAFLPEAIASVEKASREDIETIVVDDGSTDELTRRTVKTLRGGNIRVIEQENKGLATARNVAVRAAEGEYILPLDADNRIYPRYIDLGIDILDTDPSVGVVYGDANYIGIKSGLWHVGAFDFERLLRRNYIDACAVYRREVWVQNNGYDPSMPMQGHEDWDFWLGAVKRGWRFHYVPEILFDYRVAKESMITRAYGRDRENVEYILRKHADLFAQPWLDIGEERRSISRTIRHAGILLKKGFARKFRFGEVKASSPSAACLQISASARVRTSEPSTPVNPS